MNRSLRLVAPAPAPSAAPGATSPPPRSLTALRLLVLALALGGAGILGRAVWRRAEAQRLAHSLFAPLMAEAQRTSEARLSHQLADRHRPLAPGRVTRVPPLSALTQARLEQLGEGHAVAVSFALAGEGAQAQGRLRALPSSADVMNDLAASQLHDPAAYNNALLQLANALRRQPAHPQALWNRGVILAKLGLDLGAAQAFSRVAAQGESGWASEAQGRADALAVQTDERRARWRRADKAHRQLIEGRALPGPDLVADAPDWMRDGFYEAMRRAPGADQLRALVPLARALDASYGEAVLTRALETAIHAASPARADVVTRYLALGPAATPEDTDAVVRAARAAGADDIAIGALSRTRWSAPARELRALVAPTGDPWLRLLGDERAALAAALTDDYVTAEAILSQALDRCRPSRLRYRCSLLLLKLMDVHGWNHRVQPAIAAAAEARALAVEGNFLPLFVRSTGQLAVFEAHRDAHGLAQVYAAETVLWGEPCMEVQEARHYLADSALEQHDFAEARRQLAAVERCPERATRFGLAGAAVLSELVRDPKDGWVEGRPWLDEALAAVRRSAVRSPPREAFATMLQGQALIERQPEQGRLLLHRALAEVTALPRASVLGDQARAYAYIGLIGDATSRGAHDEALRLMLSLERLPDPGGCVVAVTHHFIRTSVVARGPTGKLVGRFYPRSTEPPSQMVLPADLRGVLADCPEIPVVATAPVFGAAHLLPAEWAWAYVATPRAQVAAAAGAVRRLVVSDVPSPVSKHLPPLRRWRGAARPGEHAVHLHGHQATPAAVLAAMTDADVIELHVHGIRDRALTDAIALVLSRGDDTDDNAFLTPADLGKLSLQRHPLVLLGACEAARSADYGALASSLPSALLRAGARLVLASPAPVNDADAGALLDEFQRQVSSGVRPAMALQKVRANFLARDPAHWSGELVLFE